jgi:hypothetical protein
VLVVAHQVIVNCMRYLLENLDESQILGIDRLGDVPNCASLRTALDASGPRLHLDLVNFVGAAAARRARR